jgi:hypothetical protein
MPKAKNSGPIGKLSLRGSRRTVMTDFLQPSADDITQRRDQSARLKAAITAAKDRLRMPRLEAVLTNDGILVAEFYGLLPGRHNSKFGRIFAQFDYDEFELAIEHVEAM